MQLENHHRKEQMRVVHYQPSLEDNLHRLYCRKQEKSHKLKERTVSRECSTRVMPNKGRSCCLPSYQSCSAKGENPKWKYPHLQRMALLKQASGSNVFGIMTKELLCKLSFLLSEITYDSSETIIKEGDKVTTRYILASGKVKISKYCNESKRNKFIKFIQAGSCLTDEKHHLFSSESCVSMYNVAADGDAVDCLTIDGQVYEDLKQKIAKSTMKEKSEAKEEEKLSLLRLSNSLDGFADLKLTDLSVIGTLGVGAFGKVVLVEHKLEKPSKKVLAMKYVSKPFGEKKIAYLKMERRIMRLACDNKFVVKCFTTLQDSQRIYFIMEACLGGDLWTFLTDNGELTEKEAKFYVACVIEGLQYLHSIDIVYRDLKPENIILDQHGYGKLADFGFSKKLTSHSEYRTWSFCGTPSYIAPEVILNYGHGFEVDYWACGILIYELLTGRSPFKGDTKLASYDKIVEGMEVVEFPLTISDCSEDIIRRLCRYSPNDRLGYGGKGWSDVQAHLWFSEFDFNSLRSKTLVPSYVPIILSDRDMSNFDIVSLSSDDSSADSAIQSDLTLSPTHCTEEWSDF